MSDAFDPLALDNQLCFPLYAASKALVHRYEPLLKPLGLTYTQYIVLLVLWEKDGITVNELGERLYLDSGTISPLLHKLEAKGLIHKSRQSDGRVRRIFLTEEGRNLRQKALSIPSSMGSCLRLSKEEATLLYRLCHQVMDNLSEK